jgi:hypothetical protein
MSASLTVEYEQGTTHGRARAARRHNGYYAGDFSNRPIPVPVRTLRSAVAPGDGWATRATTTRSVSKS